MCKLHKWLVDPVRESQVIHYRKQNSRESVTFPVVSFNCQAYCDKKLVISCNRSISLQSSHHIIAPAPRSCVTLTTLRWMVQIKESRQKVIQLLFGWLADMRCWSPPSTEDDESVHDGDYSHIHITIWNCGSGGLTMCVNRRADRKTIRGSVVLQLLVITSEFISLARPMIKFDYKILAPGHPPLAKESYL